jgi:gamma-glutamyltranspeptidase / glutathione hydrolase
MLLLLALLAQDVGWSAEGTKGAVAGGGAPAVAASLDALKAGGNAADAAATMLLALTVTDWDNFCFGGEVPILVYSAKTKEVEVIAGCGVAPVLALGLADLPGRGLRSTLVPAALDAILTLLERHGTRSFADCAAPAIKLLDGQGGWRADFQRTLQRLVEAEGGKRNLKAVADYFYRGPLATEIDAWMRGHDGLLRAEDLAAHVTRVEKPVSIDYRGHTIYKCGPWTQGPYLLETLRLLEGFDLKGPDRVHLCVEAMKLGLADRDVHYGDGVSVDRLLSREYADLRRPLIDPRRASRIQRPGDPANMKALLPEVEARTGLGGRPNDTTTCLVADGAGNVIAATPSGWSGDVCGPTGVWLGSRLQSFNTWKGHPNAIAPGKRPRITLTPTLVFKEGKPALAVSVAGGDAQDQVTLQMIVNHIDLGLKADASVSAPRFQTHHYVGSFGQSTPLLGSLFIEPKAGDLPDLRERGHDVTVVRPPVWWPCVLTIDGPRLRAAGDPAAKRHAAAW